MKHIAFLIPTIDRIAGAEHQLLQLATSLAKQNWKISIITLSGTGGTTQLNFNISYLSLHMRKGLTDPRGWLRFQRWLHHASPDILHSHLPHATWFARLSRLAFPHYTLVDTLHSTYTGTLTRRAIYRLTNPLTDHITAVSKAVADTHLSAKMIRQKNLTIIPNGVDTSVFQPCAIIRAKIRQQLGLQNEFLWFSAGRLDPVKNYLFLLTAFASLPPHAHLVIAGSGVLESSLRKFVKELRLNHRVRFLGFTPNVQQWMQAADGYVQSSLWEGHPIAILEAAACALPTVATDVPGTREVILHKQTGWLANSNSAQSLQLAMQQLMQLPTYERQNIGQNARHYVMQNFSLHTVLSRWEQLYASLLSLPDS